MLLDRSYSMGYSGRWPRAVEAARRALGELGPQDRAALVLFDRAPQSSGEPTTDRARLLAELDAARPGLRRDALRARRCAWPRRCSTRPASRAARSSSSPTSRRRAGRARTTSACPPSTTLTWVDVSDRAASNLAITGVDLERDYESGRERVIAAGARS